MARQLGLRNDQNLARYVIEGRSTGNQLGTGSYGSVEEVEVNGLLCAGKKIHEILLDAGNVGTREMAEKYIQECQLMSDLRHPNITQFLGICFFPDCQFPILVMERLSGNLDDLLETVPSVPLVLKRSILEDVAHGLLYLHKHNPQIIHRDLTARNVLLTSSFMAKITDFGNSRVVNLQPGQLARTLSRLPGTLAYMPPEALSANARYGPSLDIFSFGHLALFTLNQVYMFPGDLLEHTFPDPEDPNRLIGRSEVERRVVYFQQLEESLHRKYHSLIQLIRSCLNNTPSRRPIAEQLCSVLEEMKAVIEGPYEEFSKLDAMRQVATTKALKKKESEMKKMEDALATKDEDIERLLHQLNTTQMQLQLLEQEKQQKKIELWPRVVEPQKQLVPLSGLDIPLDLKWRHGKAMPSAMSFYPQAIVLNGNVYLGGGKSSKYMNTVMEYDPQKDEWTPLLPYSEIYFGMAVLKGQLLLIGGRHSDIPRTTTLISLWDQTRLQWQPSLLPLMPTPRCCVAVAYNDWWIIVAGGENDRGEMLTKVEIFIVSEGKWIEGAPFPLGAEKMTAAIVGNNVILLGGASGSSTHGGFHKEVFCLSLDNLTHLTTSYTSESWQRLQSTPFKCFTALAYNGALLAIGGEDSTTKYSVIYIYQPGEKCWIKAGDMPTDRVRCACTVLPNGEIFIAGGATSSSHSTDNLLVTDIAMVISLNIVDLVCVRSEWNGDGMLQIKLWEWHVGYSRSKMARQALRDNHDLARFTIEGEANGRQLGTGSYGSVEEIITNGLVCAGKKIHEVLLDPGNEGVRDIAGRYVQECQLMSDLRHPNITQFLGVYFLPDCQLPVLLMERLDGSLDDLLETIPNIPLVLKRSMLEDVSKGLLYLHKHTPPIIHRDLTAKNVLLTSSLVAKITDFGNARIVNLQPGQLARTLSRLPGTLAYMPPEALSANSRYGPSLDIFSFGHLALFTINQVFPGDLLEHNYPDPENPDRLTGRTEVERRGQYFESLEQTMLCGRQYQPLVQLIKDCLHNTPSRRPSTDQLLQVLEEIKATIEGPYGEFAKMDAVKQIAMVRALKGKDEDVRVKTNELAAKDGEIQQLQVQVQQKNAQIDEINTELRRRNEELQQKDNELQQKDEELQQKDTEYRRSQDSIHQINLEHQRVLEEKDACISQLQRQLETLQAGFGVAQRQVQRTDLFSVLERVLVGASSQEQSDSAISEIPLRLKWKRGRKMITGMTFYPQAVIFKGKIYVGGGSTSAENIDQYAVVTCYDAELNQWTALPGYSYVFFAMTMINEQLVLIGGRQPHTAKTTNTVGVWSESVRRWTYGVKIPPMCVLQTARDAATAIAYNNRWLIVVGGRDDAYRSLSEVDVIDVTNHQSYFGPPLPQTAHKMSAAVIGNTLVLLGGADSHSMVLNKVFSINLDDLISRAVSFRFAGASTSPWQSLPNTPVVLSTALAFNGNLLAIGGNKHIQGDLVNEKYIHLFDPSTQTWVEAGQLLVDRHSCACAVLPTGEMFLAGGSSGPNRRIQREVHIATLQ